MILNLRVLAALLVATLVCSCGQSGELYIPGNPSQMTTPQVAESATSSETEDDADEDSEKDPEKDSDESSATE
jgi:predicted small lipoprotein YifL